MSRDRSVSMMTGYRRKFRCLISEKSRTISLQQVRKASGSTGTENTATSGRHSSVLWCLTKQGDSTQSQVFIVGKIHTAIYWVMTRGAKMGGQQHLESLHNLHIPPRRWSVFLRNIHDHLQDYAKPYPSRRQCEILDFFYN